jgi:hypothetical protein
VAHPAVVEPGSFININICHRLTSRKVTSDAVLPFVDPVN